MRKKLKYFFLIIIIVIVVLLACFLIFKNANIFKQNSPVSNSGTNTKVATSTIPAVPMTDEAVVARKKVADYSLMTLGERKEFKVKRGIRVEVLRRDKDGKITDYHIIN